MSEVDRKSRPEEPGSFGDSAVAKLLLRGPLEGPSSPASTTDSEVIDLSKRGCNSGLGGGSPQVPHEWESDGQQKTQQKASKTKSWRCRLCPYSASETMAMYKHYQLHQAYQGFSMGRNNNSRGDVYSSIENTTDDNEPAKAPTIKTLLMKSAVFYPPPPLSYSIQDQLQEPDFKEICISDDESSLTDLHCTNSGPDLFQESDSGSIYDRSSGISALRKKFRMSERSLAGYHTPNSMTMSQSRLVDTDESENDEMRSNNYICSYKIPDSSVQVNSFKAYPVKMEPRDNVPIGVTYADVAVQCNLMRASMPSLIPGPAALWFESARASPMCMVGSSDNDLSEAAHDQVPHRCNDCGISFDDDVLYTLHRGCHSHSDPFICNICGTSCGNKYAFYTHILRGHTISQN